MTEKLTLPVTNTRGSGRTTRMLIRALADAGYEDKVFVLASTREQALNLRANLFEMAHSLHLRTEPFSTHTNDINIEGTLYMFYGRQQFFKTPPPTIRKGLSIYEDHMASTRSRS